MSSGNKYCIHLIAARKFLLSFLKLPEEFLREDFDICYNNQCNFQINSEIEYFGIPRKECEIPHGFVGIGINNGENVPFEMKKFIQIKNPTNSNQIDKLLGDIGEPTYREIQIKQEDTRDSIRKAFSLSHETTENLKKTNTSKFPISPNQETECNDENQHYPNFNESSRNNYRSKLLSWFRDQKPIWDEEDYFVKSELFRSTPDWKRLETYRDLISCEWGSAKVLMMIQFWQISLTFTDRLVNNKDSSIIEYLGGNEESCLPLRLLVKFERKTSKETIIHENPSLNFKEKLDIKQMKDFHSANETNLVRKKSQQKSNSSLELLSENENHFKEDETQLNKINIRYLKMVKYIQGKDKSREFKSLENRFKNLEKSYCYLYIDNQKDFFLKLQTKYDKEIINMIKTCIKGRKYDNETKLWLLPIETLYESVCMVEFLGGTIDKKVLSLLINGNKTNLDHELMFSMDELDNWRSLLPKSSRGTWYRLNIKFNLSSIAEIYRGNPEKFSDNNFKLTFTKEGIDEHHQSELIRTLRNNNISVKWDSNEKSWKIPIEQFQKVISTCRGNLEFCFSSMFDHIIFKKVQEMIKDQSFQNKIINLNKMNQNKRKECKLEGLNSSNKKKRLNIFESDEEEVLRKNYGIGFEEDYDNEEINLGKNEEAVILSCLGNDDHDNKRLETKITNMIKNIKTPKHIDKIEFILWPKHYKDWESISFLIISKDFIMNNYHPKLLLSIVSNVMIVSEGMIDYIIQKNTWPDNSFETKFELLKGLPSLESRLYISEGIFCKTKLFIVGPPGNNHFKLCTRLATLGNASFVQDPLLADYIIICDESDPNALKIKKSVPKKQASKVQNTHGETHSIQVTPKWVYDVVLDFTIIKPTSKRNHKAWISE
ncbi:uncharacterized protein cubi_02456 [Cryptosporidium ubiquitum]|uniref:BRCT domain-containing protein n=1 Tax=Cryptosporidium ubiquitum TaxID=857276 RepID=A0A1J4MG99_9CRYT|nr:uncharacterized protein cubi_02456 [Cryptosporidium ubiquitum]OII73224.1 hypothetical protein cubi_02456 [Cryptosporidium ubiquitum]